ncbi:flagellar hook protein FlgE [Lautropia dentalis]|uniref:Flagellar hook protein FlgE n=1 Tax=Lautropia dentalis TaxID=2490857 RepID=A0A3R8LP62_9BURK|nr:flagellar hook protein FlgE [Lautropia dentalis]RRN45173.1 flagellar hook protein FlgE [Lautropia dentalis]
MAFQQGLSGLNAAARHLDTIGHNVANASTVGFKASRAEFADVYATTVYGVSNVSPGIGVEVGAIAQQFAQGAITTTNNSLDLGINGGGFFRMSDNGSITYTREGQFKLDKSGYIVNASGKRLTGYPVDKNGIVTNGTAQDLKLESTDISPKATTNAAIRVNVDARATVPATDFNLTDAKTYDGGTSVSVFDSLGREHVMALYFRKTADNTWSVHGTVDGNLMNKGASLGELKFNPNGTLNTEANGGTTSPFEVTVPVGADADVQGNQKITLNFSDTTQFGTNFTVAHQEQNGNGSGKLAGFSVGRDGSLMARYTNGLTVSKGRVALANFTNPQGLQPLGGNQWGETADSGAPLVGSPQTGTLGTIQSGALESSNVDLTQELVNMITAQRVYQANAQTVRTHDQLLQTIVNLR